MLQEDAGLCPAAFFSALVKINSSYQKWLGPDSVEGIAHRPESAARWWPWVPPADWSLVENKRNTHTYEELDDEPQRFDS